MYDVVIMSGHTCCILKDRLRNRYVRHILDKIFYKLRDLKYDDKQKRYVVDNCYYRFSSRMAVGIIPKAFEPMLLELLKQNDVTYEYQLIKEPPLRKVDFNILPQWQDKPGQTEAIDFLLNSPNSMRCLALQTGCLGEDSEIRLNRAARGFKMPIKDLHAKYNDLWKGIARPWNQEIETQVRSFNGKNIQLNKLEGVVDCGFKEVFELKLQNGFSLTCTAIHPILTDTGWFDACECVGKNVMCDTLLAEKGATLKEKNRQRDVRVGPYHPYGRKLLGVDNFRVMEHRAIYEAHCLNGMTLEVFLQKVKDIRTAADLVFLDPAIWAVHHVDHDHKNNDPSNLVQMKHEDHRKHHGQFSADNFNQGVPVFSKCLSFEAKGQQRTYDLICQYPHNNFVANGMVVHNSGKTYTAIKAAILRKVPFLIITSGLVAQWEKCLHDYTDLENEDIYVIRGSKSFDKLMKLEYKPTAIIASLETIRNFAQEKEEYQDMGYSLMDVISHLGIGTKINDECHNNFFAVVSIDLAINVPVNIYLSATFIRKNPSTKQIFNSIFPFSERYGEGSYTPYADICVFSYHSNVPEKAFVMAGGYAHYRYENYIFKEEKRAHWWLSRIVKPILDLRYISIKKPGERTLVIMTKVEYIMKAVEKLQSFYPNLKVLSYVGDDEETNLEADIIVSTIGSAGEGLDVPDLVHVLNTVSIASEVRILQLLGRLRKLKNSQVYMSDVFNTGCEAHRRHIEERASIYRVKGKWFTQRQLTF